MPKSLCKAYYGRKLRGDEVPGCTRGRSCPLSHPEELTPQLTAEYHRSLGKCYCGASLKPLIRSGIARATDNGQNTDTLPDFYMVCGRTRKSIKRCRR